MSFQAVIQYLFQAKTKARSAEVNANFNNIYNAHNSLDAKVDQLVTDLNAAISSTGTNATNQIQTLTSTLNGLASQQSSLLGNIVSAPAPNKILMLDQNGNLPTSITGDASSVNGHKIGTNNGNIPILNSNNVINDANLPDRKSVV